jgi:hypothetical protein
MLKLKVWVAELRHRGAGFRTAVLTPLERVFDAPRTTVRASNPNTWASQRVDGFSGLLTREWGSICDGTFRLRPAYRHLLK